MSRQIPEAIYQFALRSDLKSLSNLCRTNKQYNRDLCNNETFWTDKLIIDFGSDPLFQKANRCFSHNISKKEIYQIFHNPRSQDIEDALDVGMYDLALFLINKSTDLDTLAYVIEYLAFMDMESKIDDFVDRALGFNINLNDWYDVNSFLKYKELYLGLFSGRIRRYIKDNDIVKYNTETKKRYYNDIISMHSRLRIYIGSRYVTNSPDFYFVKSIIIAIEKSLNYMNDLQLYNFIFGGDELHNLNLYALFYSKMKPEERTFNFIKRLRKMNSQGNIYPNLADYLLSTENKLKLMGIRDF